MYRLITLMFYLVLISITGCQQQENFHSQANEIFPPVPMKHAALFRMDNLPVSPAFFNGQWSIVIFGKTACNDDCLQRLALVNNVEAVNKLFVIDGLAKHTKLRELAGLFPNVAITMGTTASSFDNFYTQFDIDSILPAQKQQHLYLVNPSSKLVYSLQADGLTSSDIEMEIALITKAKVKK